MSLDRIAALAVGTGGILVAHLVLWPRGAIVSGLVLDAVSVGLILFNRRFA